MELESLEMKFLFKKLDYLSTEIEYKEEVLHLQEKKFFEMVEKVLNENTELKELYLKRTNKVVSKSESISKDKEDEEDSVDENVKNVYRKIAKITHPDVVDDPRINELYIKAKEKYQDNDIFALYKICNDLGIEYELKQEDKELLKNSIKDYEERIKFIEKSYTWSWFKGNEKVKNKLIIEYIKNHIL
jgi:Rieske Fe-S protein